VDVVTDIIEPGKSFTARRDTWWLRVERIAAWLVVDGSAGRHAGRIDDVRDAASEALRALPDDAALTREWSQHPLACIDPLITKGYALEFSTWRHASWWMLSFVSLGAGRVRITEKEQWVDGPPVSMNVSDERVAIDEVDEQAARARVEQELVKLTPKVVQRAA
jgi:hypothetical protein